MNLKALAVSLALMPAPTLALAASPPQLIGDWTGEIEVQGTKVALVWHVGADQVVVDSQGTVNLPGSAGTNGPNFTLGIPPVGSHFEGKISDDGKTLSGLYYAGGINPTLTLTRTSESPTLPVLKPAAVQIKGEWEGVLTGPRGPLNLVFHLTERPTADMPGATAATPASVDKIGDDYSIVVAGATFTGKLSPDGKTMTGIFGGRPLTLTRK